jgi:transaldolase
MQNAIAASLNYDKCLAQKGDARCVQHTKDSTSAAGIHLVQAPYVQKANSTNVVLCLCRLACQLDKALTNVGALLSNQVEGRVCTEIDPRLAKDKGGLQHTPALPCSAL